MKKIFALVAAVVVAFSASAQIEKGDIVVTAGIGLGNSIYGAYENSLLPINIEGEYGIAEDVFGVAGLSLGVGPAISYTSGSNTYDSTWDEYDWTYKQSSTLVAAKGYFHYSFLDVEKLDTYAAISLGYYIHSGKYTGYYNSKYSGGGLFYGFAVGARYWFTDLIGANLEAGYGLSWLKAGVTFKF